MAYNDQTFTAGQPITADMIDYIDDAVDRLDEVIENIMLAVYPVGSIYLSVNSTSPATLFGGTWEQLKDRFLLGVGDTYINGAAGGEASHTLTVNEMPVHSHSASVSSAGSHSHSASTNSTGAHTHTEQSINVQGSYTYKGGAADPIYNGYRTNNTSSAGNHSHTVTVDANGNHSHTVTVNNNGSGIAHNNMPPYLVVYMWKRTA